MVEDLGTFGFLLPQNTAPAAPAPQQQQTVYVGRQIRELEQQVQRLMLLNQALWELLRDRLQLTDADLERMAHEVDMRDGVEDGRMTDTAVRCPTCGRVSSSKHWRCLYCGQQFEKPAMG